MGCHLSTVACTGPNGFFLIVLALSWWGKLVTDRLVDSAEFETAIDDVLWVLSHIVSGIPSKLAKRRLDDSDEDGTDVPHSKRYVGLYRSDVL
jgi:hypothetical protein